MKKVTSNFTTSIKKDFFSHETNNGLQVYLANDYGQNATVSFFVNYGAIDYKFKLGDEILRKPTGIAHFLEHKMFESEGKSFFGRISELGLNINASTSIDFTKYFISGPKELIKKMIELEFELISTLTISDESVEKEKQIILQEANNAKDNRDLAHHFKYMNAVYNVGDWHNVIGTDDDIKITTREDLYDCFNAMYSTKNMICVIRGDFTEKEFEEMIPVVEEKSKNMSTQDVELIATKDNSDSIFVYDQSVHLLDSGKIQKTYNKVFDISHYSSDEFAKLGFALAVLKTYIDTPLNENITKFKDDNVQVISGLSITTLSTREIRKAVLSLDYKDENKIDDYTEKLINLIDMNEEDFEIVKDIIKIRSVELVDNVEQYERQLLSYVTVGKDFIEKGNKRVSDYWEMSVKDIMDTIRKLLKEEKYIIFKIG